MRETQSNRRLQVLLWLMLGWALAVAVRLVILQVVQHPALLKLAQQQQEKTIEVPPTRGTIFDRTGQPLAKSLPAESICVNPMKIPDPKVAAALLGRILGLGQASLLEKISAAKSHGRGFLWIKRKVSPEQAASIRSLKMDWVEFRTEMLRFYPQGPLVAQVVGSTGMLAPEDTEEHGTGGIELSFDDELSGRAGEARISRDVHQNPYQTVVTQQPEPGVNMTLTIDSNLQYEAQQALETAALSSGAKTGSLVALNPYTGEILAMANYPSFDPNKQVRQGDAVASRSNIAISTPFEPGSVFKVITLAAALETTNLTPDTIINCGNGKINLFGRVIHDHNSYSSLSMADVLAKSSNIGAIQIGLRVGDKKLYEYVRRFGFGRKTGIELPGESAGILRRLQSWEPSSIGSVAMGHEVGATSMQLALAGAVVANGGMLVKPRLVMMRQAPGGAEQRDAQQKPERVIQPETAIKMRQMMEGVVLHGTGKAAILKGYTSGGKTGSAQIYDFKAKAYTHHYNASFLGFTPVANPQLVIAVTLIGTTNGNAGFGGAVAAPVFRQVATSALRMLDVPKDLPDSVIALVRGTKADDDDLAIAGLGSKPIQLAQSLVPNQSVSRLAADAARMAPQKTDEARKEDEAVSPSTASQNNNVAQASSKATVEGPAVPDLRGLTLRAVIEESAALGIPIDVAGEGMTRTQDPPPGSPLVPGTRIKVQLAR